MTMPVIAFTNLCMAVAMVESGGNVKAVNSKHGAYGPLQIRSMCLEDINRHYGTSYKLFHFVGNMPLSRWAFEAYGKLNGCRSAEEYVKCWHYGPTGRTRKHDGDDYVKRIMTLFAELEEGKTP